MYCLPVCLSVYLQDADGHPTVHGTVQRASDSTILCVSSVLCWTVVPRWVLVLQRFHSCHAYCIRGYACPTAAQEHGRNTQNGKQTISNPGLSAVHIAQKTLCDIFMTFTVFTTLWYFPNVTFDVFVLTVKRKYAVLSHNIVWCVNMYSAYLYEP